MGVECSQSKGAARPNGPDMAGGDVLCPQATTRPCTHLRPKAVLNLLFPCRTLPPHSPTPHPRQTLLAVFPTSSLYFSFSYKTFIFLETPVHPAFLTAGNSL